jgi:hypothetical protein
MRLTADDKRDVKGSLVIVQPPPRMFLGQVKTGELSYVILHLVQAVWLS